MEKDYLKDYEYMKKVLNRVGKQTRSYLYSVSSRLAEKHDSELIANTKMVIDMLVDNEVLSYCEGTILFCHTAMFPFMLHKDYLEEEVPKASLEV